MKDYSRLKVGVHLQNGADGLIKINLVEFDGGNYDLSTKITDNGELVLVDPSRPSGYGAIIGGDPAALRALGNALVRLSKQDSDGDADTAEG